MYPGIRELTRFSIIAFQTEKDPVFWSYTPQQNFSEDVHILPQIQCSEPILDCSFICPGIICGLYLNDGSGTVSQR